MEKDNIINIRERLQICSLQSIALMEDPIISHVSAGDGMPVMHRDLKLATMCFCMAVSRAVST